MQSIYCDERCFVAWAATGAVITSLIGHNRVIVSQTSEAVVVCGAEDECAAELALPSTATVWRYRQRLDPSAKCRPFG